MKICVLQSSYEGSNSPFQQFDPYSDPGKFTDQHEFHHRYIFKSSAREQIDAAVAEGFDLFFNMMWGQHEDNVAGIDAVEYLESLDVPFIGTPSRNLGKHKADLYRNARESGGRISVPGNTTFPKFVKPSNLCGSLFIDEGAICRDQAEVDARVAFLNEKLAPGRKIALEGTGKPLDYDENGVPEDIIVQEYIDGVDYSVMVLEMGDFPVALNPTCYRFPPALEKVPFLTFDVKFHEELREEILVRSDNPALFDSLRSAAEEAFHVNKMQGGGWCNVDFRVRKSDGELFITEMNYMIALFLPKDYEFEDVCVRETFPGGHRALINVLIATKLIKTEAAKRQLQSTERFFDKWAIGYDEMVDSTTAHIPMLKDLIAEFDFDGTVLDLACGTGTFGSLLFASQTEKGKQRSRLTGVDISAAMADKCEAKGYEHVIVGPVENVIMGLESHDHIVCWSSLQFINAISLSAVLVRMFQLARRSVTVTIDELSQAYNAKLLDKLELFSDNHVKEVEAFGVPPGWKLILREKTFAYTSPTTKDDVFTWKYRYEFSGLKVRTTGEFRRNRQEAV